MRDGLKKVATKEMLRSEDLNQRAGGKLILRVIKAKHRHPPRKIWFESRPEPAPILTHPRAKSKTNFEWYNLMPYFHVGMTQA
jgi:hypothetical protein